MIKSNWHFVKSIPYSMFMSLTIFKKNKNRLTYNRLKFQIANCLLEQTHEQTKGVVTRLLSNVNDNDNSTKEWYRKIFRIFINIVLVFIMYLRKQIKFGIFQQVLFLLLSLCWFLWGKIATIRQKARYLQEGVLGAISYNCCHSHGVSLRTNWFYYWIETLIFCDFEISFN